MTRLSRVLQMIAATFVVCLVATALSQADISNGDFSAGDDFWTVPGQKVDWDYETHATAPGVIDDAYWIDVDGDEDPKVVGFDGLKATLEESPRYAYSTALGTASFTRIQQDVTLLAGETALSFEFWLSGGGQESDYFDVVLGPKVFQIASSRDAFLAGGDLYGLKTLDVSDLARDIPYMLTFQITGYADDESAMFLEIDNVRLVPVPGAAILGSLGLCTAGWFCRRKQML